MLEKGDKDTVLCKPEKETKWMLVGGDQQRSRVWEPILKQVAPCGYKPKNATINSTEATLSMMINRASSFLTMNTGLVVMYVLLHDLVRWAKDVTVHNNTGIMKAQREPDLQQLAKDIAEADQTWKKLIPSLKVLWTIPLPIDFLNFNSVFVRKNCQDPLSVREIRACNEYTDIFQDNVHQLEMIFSVQYPEIDILRLEDLLTEDAMDVKIEQDGLMVKIDPDRPPFTGPYLPKMYSNHAKNAMMKYLVDRNFLPKPDQEVKLDALPKNKMFEINSVTDAKGDTDVALNKDFENMDATEPCKAMQSASGHSENTVLHKKTTLTIDQDSEDGFEGFEEAEGESICIHASEMDTNKTNASKTDQYQCTSDGSGSKSAAHVQESTSVEAEESSTVVEVCTSLDVRTEESPVTPDHDPLSVVDVEESIVAGDSDQSSDVGIEQPTREEKANVDGLADSESQADHSVDVSENADALIQPETDIGDSLAHDLRESGMLAADVSKITSEYEVTAACNIVIQATAKDALSGTGTTCHEGTDDVIVSEDEHPKKKWKEITWNNSHDILEMDVDDELIYDDALSSSSEQQENTKQERSASVQKTEKMKEKDLPETPMTQKLDGFKSIEVLPLQNDPAETLLAKYYEKVPTCQENLMKKEQIFIGLQFIAELRITKANSTSTAPIYVCILCNKQIASQTVLVSHVNSVPHKLKCAKLHLLAVHNQFGAIPLPEWTPNTLREFREKLQEAASHLLNYRICVVNKEEFNEASALINENLDKLEAFPCFTLDSINKPLVATPEGKLNGANTTSSVDNSVSSDVAEQVPEEGTVKTMDTAEMKEVPVLIVGDNCLLSWPQSEHPNLCCSVHCQENATLPALIRMAGRMLNEEYRVLVMVAFLHDLIHQKDGLWFVKPKIDINRLAIDVQNALKFWEIKYPNLTVVWVLPHVLDLHRYNRNKLNKLDEDLSDEEKTILEKSSKDSQVFDEVQSQLREQLHMSECWPVIYNLGEIEQVELVDGFHPTEKSYDLLLKELEDFLLIVLEEHPDFGKITPAPQEDCDGKPTQEEQRRKEIRKALNHRRARMISKFGLNNSSQPQQPSSMDAPNNNSARTSKMDLSSASNSKSTQPAVSQAELQKRLEVVRERLGYNTTLPPGGNKTEKLAFGEELISALSKNWNPENNNDPSTGGMRRRIISCVKQLQKLHSILQDKQELFTNEASSHPDYYNKWCEFYARHSAKLMLQGVDLKDHDFSKDWLIEWHRYVVIILNNEQDKERQQILKVYGFPNVKMFERICITYKIKFTIRKMEMTLSRIEKNAKPKNRADRKKFATPTPSNFIMDAHSGHSPHKSPTHATPHGEFQLLMDNLIEPDSVEQHPWKLASVHESLNGHTSGHPPPHRQSVDDKQESSSGFDIIEILTKLDRLKDILPTLNICDANLFIDAKRCADLNQNPLDIFHLNRENILALHQIYTDLCESIDLGCASQEVYEGLEGVRWLIEEVRKREFCGISLFKMAKDTEGLPKAEIFEMVNNSLVEAKLSTSKHNSLEKEFMEIIGKLHAKAIEDKVRKVVEKLKVSRAGAKQCAPVEACDEMQSYLSETVDDIFPIHRNDSYEGPESWGSPNPGMQNRGAGKNPGLFDNRQRKKKGSGGVPSKMGITKPPEWSRWVAPDQAEALPVGGREVCFFDRGTAMISDSHNTIPDAEQTWECRDTFSDRPSRFSDDRQFSETGQGFNRFDDENLMSPGCPDRKRGREESLTDLYNPIEYDEEERYKRVRTTLESCGRAGFSRGGLRNNRGGSKNSRGGPGNNRGGPGNNRGGPGNNRGGPGNNRGGLGNNREGPGNNRGGPGNNRGGPGNNRGGPGNNRGGPGNNRGGPGNNRGGFGNSRGGFGNSRGESGNRPGISKHYRGRGNYPSGGNWDCADGSGDSARDWKAPEQSKQEASGWAPAGPVDATYDGRNIVGHGSTYTSPLDRPSYSTPSYSTSGPRGPADDGSSCDKAGPRSPSAVGPSHDRGGAYNPKAEDPSYDHVGAYGPPAEGPSYSKAGSSEPRGSFIGLSRPTGPSGFIDNTSTPEFAPPAASPSLSGTRPLNRPTWVPPPKTRALAENSAFGGRLGVAASNWSSSAQPSSHQTLKVGSTAAAPKPVPPPSAASNVNINELIGNIIGSVDMTSNLALPSKGALNRTLNAMQLGGMQSFDSDIQSSAGGESSQPKSTQQELKDIISAHFQDLI